MNYAIIPPINPVHLVPAVPLRQGVNRGDMDSQLQAFLVNQWEEKAYYYQKVKRSDPFSFQFSCTPITSGYIQLIDRNGKVVVNLTSVTNFSAVPGVLAPDGTQMTTFLWSMTDYTSVAPGYYRWVLHLQYSVGTSETWTSEPIELRDAHPGTLLFNYRRFRNGDDIYPEQVPCAFAFRIEGVVKDYTPESIMTVFRDQRQGLIVLDKKPFDSYKLYVGGNGHGVSDWALRTVDHILGCGGDLGEVRINDIYYAQGDGAKWDITRDNNSSLVGANIAIALPDNAKGYKFGQSTVDLFTIPAYPFYAYRVAIGSGTGFTLAQAVPVVDATALANMITAMNTAAAGQQLNGTVVNNSGVVQYVNAAGENYGLNIALILTTYFSFDIVTTGAASTSFQFQTGTIGVEWGDGTTQNAISPVSAITVNHSYTASGTKHVHVWGSMKSFSISDAKRVGLSGTLDVLLQSIIIQNGTFASNTFDFAVLNPIKSTMKTLQVKSAALTAFANGGTGFTGLTNIDFSLNSLGQADLSNLIVNVYKDKLTISQYNGSLSVVNQSPTVASLTPSGAVAKSNLINTYLWSVNI